MSMLPTRSLQGKTCLITGATGGLGRSLAESFSDAECRLFLTGRNRDRLAVLSEHLRGRSDTEIEVHSAPCDLRDLKSLPALVESASAQCGSIDILINNAGIFATKPLAETTSDMLDDMFNVNVRATIALSQLVAGPMSDNGWGRIINIGSSSSYSGFANSAAYCASKHAVLGFSRALHDELKPNNVRVYCFSPGSIKTDMGRQIANQDFETFISPEELAAYVTHAVAFDGAMVTEEVRFSRMQGK